VTRSALLSIAMNQMKTKTKSDHSQNPGYPPSVDASVGYVPCPPKSSIGLLIRCSAEKAVEEAEHREWFCKFVSMRWYWIIKETCNVCHYASSSSQAPRNRFHSEHDHIQGIVRYELSFQKICSCHWRLYNCRTPKCRPIHVQLLSQILSAWSFCWWSVSGSVMPWGKTDLELILEQEISTKKILVVGGQNAGLNENEETVEDQRAKST